MKRISTILLITIIGVLIVSCPDETTAKHTHNWGEWEITVPATCTIKGEEERACGKCGERQKQDIPINADAHNWGVAIPATCATEGKSSGDCTLCYAHGDNVTIPALGHDPGNWVQTTNPTCTEDGIETGTCERNGCDEPNTPRKGEDKLGHDYIWTIKTTPTVTEDGEEEGVCTHIPLHKETRTAYATGTVGLAYELINDDTAFRVRGGTVNSNEVYIPAFYRLDVNSEYLPVTEIGSVSDNYSDGAFYRNLNIKTVHFIESSNITTIGSNAFVQCQSLNDITFPVGLTTISNGAFYYCSGLTEIVLPTGLTSIGSGVFFRCGKLTALTIPPELSFIGTDSFTYTNIIFTVIDNSTFSVIDDGKGLVRNNNELIAYPTATGSITLPTVLTTIAGHAFKGCTNLTDVILPAGLTIIGQEAFSDCTSLTEIFLPEGLTTIGFEAFLRCISLTEISLPAELTIIGAFAFSGTSITSITLPTKITVIESVNFGGMTSLTNITLHEGLTTIGQEAFYNCTSLTEIVLPVGLNKIDMGAFIDCTSLILVTALGENPAILYSNWWDGNFSTFNNTHPDLRIEVPAASLETYKAAYGWSEYADRIFAIAP